MIKKVFKKAYELCFKLHIREKIRAVNHLAANALTLQPISLDI